jgi:hypothetical protein
MVLFAELRFIQRVLRSFILSTKIYSIDISNDCKSILPGDSVPPITEMQFNKNSLLKSWNIYQYELHEFGKKVSKIPDIWIINGALAIRFDLKELIFPTENKGLEFLPILVGGQDWLIVNCMNATDSYSREESVLYSGPEGQVFMIIHLVITDVLIEQKEVFVLEGSNRATLFMFPSIVERITKLKLNGISFREIGLLKS